MRCLLAAICFFLASISANAGVQATFTDTWKDTGSTDTADMIDIVTTTGSFSVSISLPWNGFDVSQVNESSQFTLAIGRAGNTTQLVSDALGDASKLTSTSATFPLSTTDANGDVLTVGSVTVTKSSAGITVTGSATGDVLGEEQIYALGSDLVATNQPVEGPYEITVVLDASPTGGGTFTYDLTFWR